MAAVHGVLDELLHAAVGDARGLLELGAGAVHAAGGLQAVAAREGHLLEHQHLGALLIGTHGGGQARAARADDHHVAIDRLGGHFAGIRGGLRDLKGRRVDAVLGEGLPDGVLDGVAGHGRAGDAVNGDAVGLDDLAGQLFRRHGAQAGGLVLLEHLYVVDGRGVGLHLHDHVAVDALAHAGGGDPIALRQRGDGAHRQQHGHGQRDSKQFPHSLVLLLVV